MNEKTRNVILLISVVVVLIIFIDLLFNFSGLMLEKFTSSASITTSYNGSEETDTTGLPDELDQDELNSENITKKIKENLQKRYVFLFISTITVKLDI